MALTGLPTPGLRNRQSITQQRRDLHSAVILCARLCIAKQNPSKGVNVVCEGYPSLILRVLLISLGITIRPRSSTGCTIPVAVPDIFVGFQKPSSSVDRGHSLCSLFLPQAAVASLPSCFHISTSFHLQITLRVCKLSEIIPQRSKNASAFCRGVFDRLFNYFSFL